MARENDYNRRSRTQVNVQSDWNATTGDAFIKNKPTPFEDKPIIHLTKSATQDLGGVNDTVHYVNWDSEITKDTGYTHSTSTNSSRIQVDADGRYSLYANIAITQGGSGRTTYMTAYRKNGSTVVTRGRQRNYSRGSAYGDTTTGLNTEVELSNGDYIEISITIDDADGDYVSNAINDECEIIIRKIG